MGESGELVIGGVGLARYLDTGKDAEKFAPLPSLGWERAYRSGDLVRADEAGLLFLGRADEQVKLGGRRIELGEVDAALLALPGVRRRRGRRAHAPGAGNQVLVGYVVPADGDGFDTDAAALAPARAAARRAGAAARRGRRRCRPARRARSTGPRCPGRCPPRRRRPRRGGPADRRPRPGWPRAGRRSSACRSTDPKADFFTHGGGSLTAAQLVARIRTRHPQVSVADLYQHPRLGRARRPGSTRSARPATAAARRACRRRAAPALAQALLMAAAAGAGRPALGERRGRRSSTARRGRPCPGRRTVSVVVRSRLAWLVLFSPAGRIGDRRGRRPAAAARRAARQLPARRRGAPAAVGRRAASPSCPAPPASPARPGPPATPARSARRSATDVDLHSAAAGHRPAQARARRGRRARGRPGRPLGRRRRRAHRPDPDRRRAPRVGARSTLLPGARIGKGAEIAAGLDGARRGPRRSALGGLARAAGPARRGVPWPRPGRRARAAGRSPTASRRCCSGCCPRWRRCPRSLIVAAGVAGTASPAAATLRRRCSLVAARDAWPTC